MAKRLKIDKTDNPPMPDKMPKSKSMTWPKTTKSIKTGKRPRGK